MMDLEEVVGRNAEDLNERVLNRLRQLADACTVVLTFEQVDFGERHDLGSLSKLSGGGGRSGLLGGQRSVIAEIELRIATMQVCAAVLLMPGKGRFARLQPSFIAHLSSS